jgi:hypothetical protein
LEEPAAEIGSVDLSVTIDAGKFWIVALAVAFQADGPNFTTDQKESIQRSMGCMADRAPFHFDREVFKDPGASLFRVTLKTDVVIKFIPFFQTGPCPGPVRGMTV